MVGIVENVQTVRTVTLMPMPTIKKKLTAAILTTVMILTMVAKERLNKKVCELTMVTVTTVDE